MKNRSFDLRTCPATRPCTGLAQATGAFLAAAALLAALPAAAAESDQVSTVSIPVGFVHLTDVAQTIQLDIRYSSGHNFVGRPISGYLAPTCILSRPAANRLRDLQRELRPMGLTLKVFDCYRPQQAVNDFVAWSKDPDDQKTKAEFYPNEAKETLFDHGYVAAKSSHSRGSTVDLTLAALPSTSTANGPPLPTHGTLQDDGQVDMGTPFDLFDVKSHTDNPDLPEDIRYNRAFLKGLMEKYGFHNLPEEWWHFTLVREPYPDFYFNFPVR
jgi:D-alanyl-D-alanine dipeptidase